MDTVNKYLNKKVLITGGGGFIGSNLATKLVELGANVKIMDSQLKGHGFNNFNLAHLRGRIEIDFADIRDREAVERNIAGQEIIFNLAAQVGEKNSLDNPGLDKEINVGGHCNVLDAVFKINPSARIVFTGSRLQYGKINGLMPVAEDRPLNPLTPYAKNKTLGEQIYMNMHKQRSMQTTAVRIANPYGPRASITNPGYCITNWFVGRALAGSDLSIYGDGNQLRDYLYIDDLVDALLLVGIEKKAVGQVFNVGSGIGTPFSEMAQKIVELTKETNSRVKFVEWPVDAKDRETGDFVADISKIRDFLNWSPRYSLGEGLKKTIDFYKLNGQEYLSK